jgi:hypothetical protein
MPPSPHMRMALSVARDVAPAICHWPVPSRAWRANSHAFLRTADLILDLFVDRVFRIENQEAASDLTVDSWHRVDGYFIVVALGCTGHGHLRRCRRVAAAVHEEDRKWYEFSYD